MSKVTHIGSHMYGDGEYVVEFSGVNSFLAPPKATVITPSGHIYDAEFKLGTKVNAETARTIIAQVRAVEKRRAIVDNHPVFAALSPEARATIAMNAKEEEEEEG